MIKSGISYHRWVHGRFVIIFRLSHELHRAPKLPNHITLGRCLIRLNFALRHLFG